MRSALALAVLLVGAGARAGEALPDPTRPEIPAAVEPVVAAGRFELRAVLIGPARRVAVINGRAVERGEIVDGAEVLAIEPGRVRLRTPEGERELVLAAGVHAVPTREESR